MSDSTTETTEPAPVKKTVVTAFTTGYVDLDPIEKADAMTAVFDQDGKLIGAVKPNAIVPLDGGAASEPDPAPDADAPTPDADTAAPAAEVGADANAPAVAQPVEKGAELPATIDENTPIDELVKSAEDGDDPLTKRLAETVKAQRDEIAELMKAPAPGGPIVNGGPMPDAKNLRGQSDGGAGGIMPDADKVATLRKTMQEANTPAEREEAAAELNKLAIASLAGIREQGPRILN